MKRWLGYWLLLGFPAMSRAASPLDHDIKYSFATRDYSIRLSVAFFEPYWGRRLSFFTSIDTRKEFCYSGDRGTTGKCIERFVGAVAGVTYSVKLANGGTPRLMTIREYVTVSAQSPGLPERVPLSMTQRLIEGIGSDIQAFGYEEASLKQADRIRIRRQAQAAWWRLCRQELYVDEEVKPFAIVEWKHTLNRISIVQIYAPSDRE
ncbi:MAG: hypothetical protein ACJ73N_06995 [Bryobacteraceae bacterium]